MSTLVNVIFTNLLARPPALHAIMRLPDHLRQHPFTKDLYQLAASTSQRKYGKVYARTQELHNALKNADVAGIDLQSTVDALLTRFLGMLQSSTPVFACVRITIATDAFRTRTLLLLAKAYSAVPLSLAQSYLECTPEQVLTGKPAP